MEFCWPNRYDDQSSNSFVHEQRHPSIDQVAPGMQPAHQHMLLLLLLLFGVGWTEVDWSGLARTWSLYFTLIYSSSSIWMEWNVRVSGKHIRFNSMSPSVITGLGDIGLACTRWLALVDSFDYFVWEIVYVWLCDGNCRLTLTDHTSFLVADQCLPISLLYL